MKKEFIPYEQALALKELGFDVNCFSFYSCDNKDKIYYCIDPDDLTLNWDNQSKYDYNNFSHVYRTSAPLYQQAFRWFRDKHDLTWEHTFDDSQIQIWIGDITYPDNSLEFFKSIEVKYDGYSKAIEEAELECLKKLIEIIKDKKS